MRNVSHQVRRAALLALYAHPTEGINPATLPVQAIHASPLLISNGKKIFVTFIGAMRFVSMICWDTVRGVSANGRMVVIPALLTNISNPRFLTPVLDSREFFPSCKWDSTCRSASWMEDSCVTSRGIKTIPGKEARSCIDSNRRAVANTNSPTRTIYH